MISTSLRSPVVVYALAVGSLVVYNIRWKHISSLLGTKPRRLPMLKVSPDQNSSSNAHRPTIILLHGMWHDASYFHVLQLFLKNRGYTSYAIELLPGERLLPGFTQKEIVQDLNETLRHCDGDEFVLLGHSQGGLVVQSCLKNSPTIRRKAKAVVLMGTYPLGLVPPMGKLLRTPRNMFNHIGYAWICMFGKLLNVNHLKHIFLLPTTDENTLQSYTSKLLAAPSDGFITVSHFPEAVGVLSTKPALVLGAREDVIYPPHLLEDDFSIRFPNAVHVSVPNQAHCFMDPSDADNDQDTFDEVLVKWLDGL